MYAKFIYEAIKHLSPKSNEEIDKYFDELAEEAADILIKYYNFIDYTDAYDYVYDHKKKILALINDDLPFNEILHIIIFGSWINEAIKHLSPKSEEEIRSSFKNLSPQEKLETGSEEGLLWLVKDALAAGADVHARNDYALRWASKNGHVEVVKVLLAVGADVHARNDYALRWASQNGHVEMVKVLLVAGADVHARDDYALQWASEKGHDEVVKVLLAAGADVHADNDYALQWASGNGHVEVVKVLLAAGTDVHAGDDLVLRWASKNGHVEVVKVLLAVGADVHARDDYALQWASGNGHVEVVKVLLAAGADVHAGDDYALQWASRNGHIEVVKVLKDHIKKKKINEAIKHLSPKSKEEINKALKNLSPNEKVNTGVNQNLLWVVKKGLEEGGLVTEFQINSAINWNNREILYLFSKEPLKYTDKLKIGFYLQDSDISNEAIKKGAIV